MRASCLRPSHIKLFAAVQFIVATILLVRLFLNDKYLLPSLAYSRLNWLAPSVQIYESARPVFVARLGEHWPSSDMRPGAQYLDCLYVTCIVYSNEQWDIHSDAFDTAFRRLFASASVGAFTTYFLRQCRHDRPLFGGFLGNTTFRGFGSGMNNALAAYHIATATDRRFQIVMYNWHYTPLAEYFEDFAAHTLCPVFRNLSEREGEFMLNQQVNCSVKYFNNAVVLNNSMDQAPAHPYNCFGEMREVIRILYNQDPDDAFQTRSNLARSIWQLRPSLYNFIKVLLSPVLVGGFIGVHIRKGDKIRSGEMEHIPLERYVDKIKCMTQKSGSKRIVYVMADEMSSYMHVKKTLSSESFSVHNMQDLIRLHQFEPEDILVRPVNDWPRELHLLTKSNNFWHRHTGQIIVELTIMALADEVVCTMSSNLCRLAALLRGERSSKVHSLDLPWNPL